jgi:hypothetical protein
MLAKNHQSWTQYQDQTGMKVFISTHMSDEYKLGMEKKERKSNRLPRPDQAVGMFKGRHQSNSGSKPAYNPSKQPIFQHFTGTN